MTFIYNEESNTLHAENPLSECNIPEARKEGDLGTVDVSIRAMALLVYEKNAKLCKHCLEPDAVPETPL